MVGRKGVRRLARILGAGLGVLLLTSCERPNASTTFEPTRELVILTPHNDAIRYAFEAAFTSSMLAEGGAPVRIDYIYRGTPQCVDYLMSVRDGQGHGAAPRVPDIMFGGGIADHTVLADAGLLQRTQLSIDTDEIPDTVNGIPMRDADNRWFATGLSSFGLLVNARVAEQRGLPVPTTWADLGDADLQSWIAVADPRASGSHRECMVLVLQSLGWDAGWRSLMRTLANTRALSPRSSAALQMVQQGQAVATFCVNFDGQALADESEGALRYVSPPGATTVTPDVMSVLRFSKQPELAQAFVEFVLSPRGQALWMLDAEARQSPGKTLFHYAIRPSLYEEQPDAVSVQGNPLTGDLAMTLDIEKMSAIGRVLELVVPAAVDGENGVLLQRAWQACVAAGLPEQHVAQLMAPPIPESELEAWASASSADQDGAAGRAETLASAMRDRYQQVLNSLQQ